MQIDRDSGSCMKCHNQATADFCRWRELPAATRGQRRINAGNDALGGGFFLSGVLVMAYNIAMTILQSKQEASAIEAKLAAKLARA